MIEDGIDLETLVLQKALQQGISAGLEKALTVCQLNPDWLRIFESGSSACIWDPDPAKTCHLRLLAQKSSNGKINILTAKVSAAMTW